MHDLEFTISVVGGVVALLVVGIMIGVSAVGKDPALDHYFTCIDYNGVNCSEILEPLRDD